MSKSPAAASSATEPSPITLRTLRAMVSRHEPIACLAVYDATFARLMDRAGVHLMLAGDSAAEVVLGLPRTVHMPMDFALHITAAVRRGARRAHVMADMPFMSYQASPDEAMTNAGAFMTRGGADSVKLEADESFAPLVERMTRAGIPVCAHVGSRPQTAGLTGGYASAGRTQATAEGIIRDAVALEQAGAVLLLIEAVPEEVTRRVVEATHVPVIGIGAGTACHGQILVLHDLLGLSEHPPRFAKPAADLAPSILEAGRNWVSRVSRGEIGGQGYSMKAGEIVEPSQGSGSSAEKSPKSIQSGLEHESEG